MIHLKNMFGELEIQDLQPSKVVRSPASNMFKLLTKYTLASNNIPRHSAQVRSMYRKHGYIYMCVCLYKYMYFQSHTMHVVYFMNATALATKKPPLINHVFYKYCVEQHWSLYLCSFRSQVNLFALLLHYIHLRAKYDAFFQTNCDPSLVPWD